MKGNFILLLALGLMKFSANAIEPTAKEQEPPGSCCQADSTAQTKSSRLVIGGYGEATAKRNFYSDNVFRYQTPEKYRNAPGHTRLDLPHVVLMLGYDFGKGWSLGTEIEFEHGGTGAAVELEPEEGGEYEKEVEKGGEVALEQFWLQKSFSPALNLRLGHMVVPVGKLNMHHLPTEFFTVERPEAEFTILPSTWHATGVGLWGFLGKWRYELMVTSSLNSNMFSHDGFIHKGAASPFEFSPSNKLALAFRVDNYTLRNLRIGLSGFYGETFNNSNQTSLGSFSHLRGALGIASLDFDYTTRDWILRGQGVFAQLGDAKLISEYNVRANVGAASPYKKTAVGKQAYAYSLEGGYNLFALIESLRHSGKKLYLFGRYEAYDSFIPEKGRTDYSWSDKKKWTIGLNFLPIKEILIKAEYSQRLLQKGFPVEPSLAIGIAYAGLFTR